MQNGKLDLSREALAQMMDFSSLNPDVTRAEIIECCNIAKEYNFKGFHTNPCWAPLVASELEGTGIETAYIVSFPFGTNDTAMKVAEAKHGASLLKGKPWTIDMVTNVGALKGKEYDYYRNDIAQVAKVCHDNGADCKAILEVSFLTEEEVVIACQLASEAGCDWVKTSTGRHGGPTINKIRLMRANIAPHMQVKVAGTGSFFTPMVALGCLMAGATRIGTRSAPLIVDELSTTISDLLKETIK